jgi:hypothetical protein
MPFPSGAFFSNHFFTNGYFKLADLKMIAKGHQPAPIPFGCVGPVPHKRAGRESDGGGGGEDCDDGDSTRRQARPDAGAASPPPEAIQRPQRAGLEPAGRGRRRGGTPRARHLPLFLRHLLRWSGEALSPPCLLDAHALLLFARPGLGRRSAGRRRLTSAFQRKSKR